MLIGEVIERCGVTRDTIRHYEAQGLIDEPDRLDNNYRDYAPETVNRVQFIRDMQGVGFTLRQTRELLGLYDEGVATCGNTAPLLQSHLKDLDEKIGRLMEMREKLGEFLGGCRSDSMAGMCTPIVDPCGVYRGFSEMRGRE
jgi:DNA-binding transcriptional MerR regulator